MENRKVLAYIIVKDSEREDLSTSVMRLLEKGYELYGNPIMTMYSNYNGVTCSRLNQAMVKYE